LGAKKGFNQGNGNHRHVVPVLGGENRKDGLQRVTEAGGNSPCEKGRKVKEQENVRHWTGLGGPVQSETLKGKEGGYHSRDCAKTSPIE